MATGIAEQSTELEAMQLTRVVRDTADLSEYISASVVGSPNIMTSGNHDHVEYNGALPFQRHNDYGFYYTELTGDPGLPPTGDAEKLSKDLDSACNNEKINSYNNFQLKHPIVYVTIDSTGYDMDDGWFIKGKSLNPSWQVYREDDPSTHARADALLVA